MGVAYTYAKGMGYTGYDLASLEEIGGPELVKAVLLRADLEDRTHNLVINYVATTCRRSPASLS